MSDQPKYIDLRRDQYQTFFNEAEYPGVTWVFAFQKKLESYIQASGMLADANINNPEIPKLKDLGFAALMPELGPYLLVKYSDELRSLRLTLSQIFLFYVDDLVKVEIRTRKDKTLLFTDETSIEGIQLENKTIESWAKHEALEIKL